MNTHNTLNLCTLCHCCSSERAIALPRSPWPPAVAAAWPPLARRPAAKCLQRRSLAGWRGQCLQRIAPNNQPQLPPAGLTGGEQRHGTAPTRRTQQGGERTLGQQLQARWAHSRLGIPVTWKSVRLRAVVCRTTTSMRCCPSALRTAALSGFSPGWSAGHGLTVRRINHQPHLPRGEAGRAASRQWRSSLAAQEPSESHNVLAAAVHCALQQVSVPANPPAALRGSGWSKAEEGASRKPGG